MHVPNLGIGGRYGVETVILVLSVVKHTTLPSVVTLEQVKILRNGTGFCHSSVAWWKTLCTSDISYRSDSSIQRALRSSAYYQVVRKGYLIETSISLSLSAASARFHLR
jgi:hypothetical protein